MKASVNADYRLVLPYGDRRIRCEVRRSRLREKHAVAIHVDPDGRVLVDAPRHAEKSDIRVAVTKRLGWVNRRLIEVEGRLRLVMPREFVSGETVFYLGRRYRLKVIANASAQAVRLRGGYLEVSVSEHSPNVIRKEMDSWYRNRAKLVLKNRLNEICKDLRWVKTIPPVTIRTMQVQWGSCSPQGRITLNPALVRAPRECIDYVVLHELCHLKQHNHSIEFYRLLNTHLPDWKRIKNRLDEMAEVLLSS